MRLQIKCIWHNGKVILKAYSSEVYENCIFATFMQKPKGFLDQLFHRGRNITDFISFNRAKAVKWQEKTLKKMIFKAKDTEFGKTHSFEDILISASTSKAFADKVPFSDYSQMHPWWQREYNGESNVTWPGRPEYFALSSGTSEGSSKYIPVTKDQLKAIMRASRRQLFAVVKTDVPKDFLTKHYLMISGSTDLSFNGVSYSGDLSGITTANVPGWFERFAIPGETIKKQRDWHAKMEAMVESAPDWDVVMVAGGPAWIKILLEKVIAKYNLNSIHDIWPNLSVYAWGAVALTPYRKQIDSMLARPIKYFETYLASEGFVAFQTNESSEGMRLVFRNNTYYEFVPFNEKNFDELGNLRPEAETLGLQDVKEGEDYAILLTTCAGAWRYLIGDTVRFTDLDACEIKISGRTKHYLSICGEHLSVDNMYEGIIRTANDLQTSFPEFTVKGLKEPGKYGHHWYLACDNANINPDEVQRLLDEHLSELNDDYAVERKHVLKDMQVTLLPESVFLGWMEKHGKLGGQAKFPRVLTDALYQDWCDFVAGFQQNKP